MSMSRILIVLLGVVMAGLLAASPATANTEVVRIADPTLVDNVSASTQYNNVYLEPARSTDLQRWRIDRAHVVGAVRVINVATGGCLTVFNRFGPIEGIIATQEHCISGWTWQQWRLVDSVNGTVRLYSVGTDMCLTVGPTASGQSRYMLMYNCGTQPRQDFRLVAA
jgi:hypothetical protein